MASPSANCDDQTDSACYDGVIPVVRDYGDEYGVATIRFVTTTPTRIISIVLSPSHATAEALEAAVETAAVVPSSVTDFTYAPMAPHPMAAPFPKRDEFKGFVEVPATTVFEAVDENDAVSSTTSTMRTAVGKDKELLEVSMAAVLSANNPVTEVTISTINPEVYPTIPSAPVPTIAAIVGELHTITVIPYSETSALGDQEPAFSIAPCRPYSDDDLRNRPVYRAAILGNAYGGGYVASPSVCVSIPPERDNSVSPGYGDPMFGLETAVAVYSSSEAPIAATHISAPISGPTTPSSRKSSGGVYESSDSGITRGTGVKIEAAMDAAVGAIVALMVIL